MGKATSPPIKSKEGARRSQPRSARCFTRWSSQRETYAGSWTARHREERALLHEVVVTARNIRWLMDGSSQRGARAASRGGRHSEKHTLAHGRLVTARSARCFTRWWPQRETYAGSWTARYCEERALLQEVVATARHVRRPMDGYWPREARAASRAGSEGEGRIPGRGARAVASGPGLQPLSGPALVSELGEELLRALLGAVCLRLGILAAHHHLYHHVRHDARAVQLGEEGKEVVLGPAEADGQEALLVEARDHHVVPRLPLLDARIGEVLGIVEHRLEDGREMDRHRVTVREVVLLLVEEAEKLEGLVGILRLGEHRPVLAVERRDAHLPGGTVRAEHGLEVLGVAHVLRRVALDVADGACSREIRHGDLARGERGEGVEVLLPRPALRHVLVELLKILERLQHGAAVELGPPRLGVDPGPAVAGQPLRGMDEAHVELLPRHLHRVALVVGERGGELQHVLVGLRRLDALLLAQVAPLREIGGAHGVSDAVVLAVEVLQLEGRLVDVLLSEGADELVHGPDLSLHVQGGRHERVEMRQVGGTARGQRGEELGVEIAPAERLLLDLEAGELLLELRDARVLDDLDGLGLDLRVPDLELARLLAEDGGGAPEHGGGRRARRAAREEPPARDRR